jgi:hypothetical protein
MRVHLDVLGLLHLGWGGLGVLAGLSLGVLAVGTHAALFLGGSLGAGELAVVWVLAIAALIFCVGGVSALVIGRALRRRHGWGRMAALILAIPNLLFVPFGTALSIYACWVLLNDDARREFGQPLRGASPGTDVLPRLEGS